MIQRSLVATLLMPRKPDDPVYHLQYDGKMALKLLDIGNGGYLVSWQLERNNMLLNQSTKHAISLQTLKDIWPILRFITGW